MNIQKICKFDTVRRNPYSITYVMRICMYVRMYLLNNWINRNNSLMIEFDI